MDFDPACNTISWSQHFKTLKPRENWDWLRVNKSVLIVFVFLYLCDPVPFWKSQKEVFPLKNNVACFTLLSFSLRMEVGMNPMHVNKPRASTMHGRECRKQGHQCISALSNVHALCSGKMSNISPGGRHRLVSHSPFWDTLAMNNSKHEKKNF